MMKKSIALVLFPLALAQGVQAQNGGGIYDPIVTLYDKQPLNLNPALTGNMDSKWRLMGNFRNSGYAVQRSYRTAAGSFDIQVPINAWAGNIWGFGLNFVHDEQGDVHFRDTRVNLSMAVGQYLDPRQVHSISVGFQAGFGSRGIAYNDVWWNNQWVGEGFQLRINPNEPLDEGVKSYADLSTGIQYTYYSGDLMEFTGGASMYHVNRPDVSLYKDTSNTELQRRHNLHAEFTHRIRDNSHFAVKPSVLYSRQALRSLYTVGSKFQFIFTEGTRVTGKRNESSVTFGGFLRTSRPDTNYGPQMNFIATVTMEFAGFTFGGGYEVPLLQPYLGINGYEGAFEFMVGYRAGYNRGLYNKYSPKRKGKL